MFRLHLCLLYLILHIHIYQSTNIRMRSANRPKHIRSRVVLPSVSPRDMLASNPVPKSGATAAQSQCQPRIETFETCDDESLPPDWVSLSSNPNTYKMNPDGGVNLVLMPPAGPVNVSKDGKTNDKLGDGATLNSTFSLLYGKVSITATATEVPGSVTALVLFGTETADEIDIEILGGDPTHWQTNVFRPAPGETEPLYGVFGGIGSYPGGGRTGGTHTYVIDWSPERIIWSVDGQEIRTLTPDQTLHNGQRHYPSAMSRIQMGLWDGSNPLGTSEWAKGPIPWSQRQNKPISALIKSITVECPY